MLVNGLTASLGLVIFTAAIESIPRDLLRAARVDGATTAQIVWRLILPLLRWPIMFVTTYQTLSLLASFEAILLLTNGIPMPPRCGRCMLTTTPLHFRRLAMAAL